MYVIFFKVMTSVIVNRGVNNVLLTMNLTNINSFLTALRSPVSSSYLHVKGISTKIIPQLYVVGRMLDLLIMVFFSKIKFHFTKLFST